MRRFFILILAALIVVAFGATPLIAGDHTTHSCKMEKSCCKEKADCCKTADAKCCADSKTCCDDADCCKTAADGSHSCAMKHADGSACTHSCCKDKSCH